MNTLSSRLQAIIEQRNVTITEFERLAKVSKGVFAKAIKNNTGINSVALEKIISIMPEVNLNWLLTGQGDMLIKNESQILYGENDYISIAASPEAKYGRDEDSDDTPTSVDKENSLILIMNNISEAIRRNAIANENNSVSLKDLMDIYKKSLKG